MSSLDNIIKKSFNDPSTIEDVKARLKTIAGNENPTWNVSIVHLLIVLGMASQT